MNPRKCFFFFLNVFLHETIEVYQTSAPNRPLMESRLHYANFTPGHANIGTCMDISIIASLSPYKVTVTNTMTKTNKQQHTKSKTNTENSGHIVYDKHELNDKPHRVRVASYT